MSVSYIDEAAMLASLKEHMTEQMMKAAEPVLKEAVKQAEIAMRKELGYMFIALIDKSFSVERFGNDIRVIVKQERN